MEWKEYIDSNPKILYGKPVIKGTRIPVDLILEKLSFGESFDEILQSYPDLTKESIYACLSYATAILRNEEVKSIAS